MTSLRPRADHQEAVSRRLALLTAELASTQAEEPGPAGQADEPWLDGHTRIRPLRAVPDSGPERVVVSELSPPAVPVPGRHAARRGAASLLPEAMRGRVALGPTQLVIVAVLVAVGIAVTGWWVVRGDSERIEAQRSLIGELPAALRRRWLEELGLSAAAATTLTQHPAYARFFQQVCAEFPQPVKAANWILTEVLRDTTSHGLSASFPVKPAQVAELLQLVDAGKISGAQAKKIHTALVGTDRAPADVVQELGLSVVSDTGELRTLCQAILDQNPKNVASYRAGKKALLGFFVGQAMKQSGGRANPELVSRLFTELLESSAPLEGS